MTDQKEKIRYLRDVSGLSFRQIAKQTGISRHSVLKQYCGTSLGRQPREKILSPYHDLMASWFGETSSLKAVQVWKRLKERGVVISRRRVEAYTEIFRRKKKDKVYFPLTFLPGEEGQVDWFFVQHPNLGKLWGFTLVLSYSRYAFVHIFERSSFEFFMAGHLKAFEEIKGTPHALRYDNLKSVVLKREPLTYNPSFLEFARHYNFEIRLCNVRAGNEKGRVERLIRSIRDTFLNTATHHQSLIALNEALHEWVKEKNTTLHRSTDCVPEEKKKEEKLKILTDHRWNNRLLHAPKLPTKTGFMIFDTNLYSVPDYAAHSPLALHTFVDHIEIYDSKNKRVASHPRCFERKKEITNPLHKSINRLSDKAKRERIFVVIQNMDPLLKTFLEHNQDEGEDPYQTAYVIFKLLREHSRGMILSLFREAIKNKKTKLNFVMSKLHREEVGDLVSPQNAALLTLDYQRRPLEDYDA